MLVGEVGEASAAVGAESAGVSGVGGDAGKVEGVRAKGQVRRGRVRLPSRSGGVMVLWLGAGVEGAPSPIRTFGGSCFPSSLPVYAPSRLRSSANVVGGLGAKLGVMVLWLATMGEARARVCSDSSGRVYGFDVALVDVGVMSAGGVSCHVMSNASIDGSGRRRAPLSAYGAWSPLLSHRVNPRRCACRFFHFSLAKM